MGRSRILAIVGLIAVAGAVGASFAVAGSDSASESSADMPAKLDATFPTTDAADLPDPAAPAEVPDPADVTAAPDVPDLPDLGIHPDLVDIDGWLQSDVTSLEELRGQVVAVQFWTFGCSNCKATLPHMQDLYAKYHDQGFEIVGIHAPEFDYEAEVANITEAASELGVTWPIALDRTKRTFHSWQEGPTAHWPRIYLLDRAGHIRYDHIGEGRYSQTDAAVEALLAEPG